VVQFAGGGMQVDARLVVGTVEFARDTSAAVPEAVVDARPVRPKELSQRPADVRRATQNPTFPAIKRQTFNIFAIIISLFSFHPILGFAAPLPHFPIRFSD